MPKSIDLDINTLEKKDHVSALFEFLSLQANLTKANAVCWEANTLHAYGDTVIKFNQTLLCQKEDEKNNYRCAFVAKELLGAGNFAGVYPVTSFRLNGNKQPDLIQDIEWVAKVVLEDRKDSSGIFHTLVGNELVRSRQAGHLNMQAPIFSSMPSEEGLINKAYLLMHKMPGITLGSFIEKLKKKELTINIQEYLSLSYQIISTHHRQATGKKLLHKDLTLNNILVNMHSCIEVNLLDYAFSSSIGEIGLIGGTPFYMAPELYKYMQCNGYFVIKPQASAKIDIYSLGAILLELWSNHLIASSASTNHLSDSEYNDYVLKQKENPESMSGRLFQAIPDTEFCIADKERIKKMILSMLSVSPEKRPEAAELLSNLSELLAKYSCEVAINIAQEPIKQDPSFSVGGQSGYSFGNSPLGLFGKATISCSSETAHELETLEEVSCEC